MKIFQTKNKTAGFSVLFASLIGSLVLTIGLAILSITLKQITLATAGRESQKAFYAADTGIEFAFYLDRGGENQPDADGPGCPNGVFPRTEPGLDVICDVEEFPYKFDEGILNVDNDGDGGLGEGDYFKIIEDEYDVGEDEGKIVTKISVQRAPADLASNPICFDLYVTKGKSTDQSGQVKFYTKIESRGFSTCDVSSKNRFERAILAEY